MRQAYVAAPLALIGLIFAGLVLAYTEQQSLRPLAEAYVQLVPNDLGAPNVITGILLNFRAFDTVGEVAVLCMVATSAGLILGSKPGANENDRAEKQRPASEIVQTGAQVLVPMIAIFAAYIIMNGHISAGGGFQGGAVIASCILLLMLAFPEFRTSLAFLSNTEAIAGVLFVVAGMAGLVWASGFLDSRFLPRGQFGAFFSAGAIPLLSILLGVKVGCELSVILSRFRA